MEVFTYAAKERGVGEALYKQIPGRQLNVVYTV